MRDLPNPSLIDTPYSPKEEDVPSWGIIGVVFFVFVITVLVFAGDEGRPLRGNPLSSASPIEPLSGVSTKGFNRAQGRGR